MQDYKAPGIRNLPALEIRGENFLPQFRPRATSGCHANAFFFPTRTVRVLPLFFRRELAHCPPTKKDDKGFVVDLLEEE